MTATSRGGGDEHLRLLDWRRQVAQLYAEVRAAGGGERAWGRWRDGRDRLFAQHPQSPLEPQQRRDFGGLRYLSHDPALRVLSDVEALEPTELELPDGDGMQRWLRVARAHFELGGRSQSLDLHWLGAYGGGLFVPFADATNGETTYGGGRYLLDTVKGADLGTESGRLVLDFNGAYQPSCAYSPRWVCPLAQPGNRLDVAVEAGERSGTAG